jgi:hypothetical protein
MYGRTNKGTNGYYYNNEQIWTGDLTTLPPGESIEATMTFTPEEQRNSRRSNGQQSNDVGDEVQFECEFVVGLGTRSLKNFRLYDLLWNNLKVSGDGRN